MGPTPDMTRQSTGTFLLQWYGVRAARFVGALLGAGVCSFFGAFPAVWIMSMLMWPEEYGALHTLCFWGLFLVGSGVVFHLLRTRDWSWWQGALAAPLFTMLGLVAYCVVAITFVPPFYFFCVLLLTASWHLLVPLVTGLAQASHTTSMTAALRNAGWTQDAQRWRGSVVVAADAPTQHGGPWRLDLSQALRERCEPGLRSSLSRVVVDLQVSPLQMLYLRGRWGTETPRVNEQILRQYKGMTGKASPRLPMELSFFVALHNVDVEAPLQKLEEHPCVTRCALHASGLQLLLHPLQDEAVDEVFELVSAVVGQAITMSLRPWSLLEAHYGLAVSLGDASERLPSAEGFVDGARFSICTVRIDKERYGTRFCVEVGGCEGVAARRREAHDEGGRIGDPVLDSLLFLDGAPPAVLQRRFARDEVRGSLLDVLHGNPGSSLKDGVLTLVLDGALGEDDLKWLPLLSELGRLISEADPAPTNHAEQAAIPHLTSPV